MARDQPQLTSPSLLYLLSNKSDVFGFIKQALGKSENVFSGVSETENAIFTSVKQTHPKFLLKELKLPTDAWLRGVLT